MRPLQSTDQEVRVIDQRQLPHHLVWRQLESVEQAADAIRSMVVRGAPLIGATGAFGIALAMREAPEDSSLERAHAHLLETRPTAVNLRWALERVLKRLRHESPEVRFRAAWREAQALVEQEAERCRSIGEHGLPAIMQIHQKRGRPVQILTHCNAGALGTFDYGTATAPIYLAHERGIPVHVWVDETRPRNQGAALTLWELTQRGVPCTLIVDNAGGHLMQRGEIDLCFVGADRVSRRGDACNKIGTYLKALAAFDNGVPFFVCLPSSTIDWGMVDGVAETPIEERSPKEVTHIVGRTNDGAIAEVSIAPDQVQAANPAFDVTPARLITALITERGSAPASESALRSLFPDALNST